jgi:hypothetical protein
VEHMTCSLCGRAARFPEAGLDDAILACSECGQCLRVVASASPRSTWGVAPSRAWFGLSAASEDRLWEASRRGFPVPEILIALGLASSGMLFAAFPERELAPYALLVRAIGISVAAFFGMAAGILLRGPVRRRRPLSDPEVIAIPKELPGDAARLGNALRVFWICGTYRWFLVVMGLSGLSI